MAGPMAYFAPGYRSHTACAMTWAVECRSTCRPSGSATITGSTEASSSTGQDRSTGRPSTRAQMASVGRTVPTGVPAATSWIWPSGRVSFGIGNDNSERLEGTSVVGGLFDQMPPQGFRHRGRSVGRPELSEDVLQVCLDGFG